MKVKLNPTKKIDFKYKLVANLMVYKYQDVFFHGFKNQTKQTTKKKIDFSFTSEPIYKLVIFFLSLSKLKADFDLLCSWTALIFYIFGIFDIIITYLSKYCV